MFGTKVESILTLWSIHSAVYSVYLNSFTDFCVTTLLISLPYLSHPAAFPSLFTVMTTAPCPSLVTPCGDVDDTLELCQVAKYM